MNRLRWGVVCVAAVGLFGCPQKPSGDCAGVTCTESERCDMGALLCVEDEPPVIVLTPLAVVTTSTFTLSGVITDDEAVTSAEWSTASREAAALSLNADGSFAQVIDSPDFDAEDLVVHVSARDRRGEVTKQLAVRVDRRGPTITLVSPALDAGISTPSFAVAVKATDGSGSLGTFTVNGVAVANPMSGVEATVSIDVPATANHEALPVTVVATDARQNPGSQVFTFFADRVAPTVNIVSPASGSYVTTASFAVEADVTEPGPLRSVVFRVGTTDVPGTEGPAGRWSAMLPAGLVEQDETITVTATDSGGNIGTATRVVKVDRVAPVVTITAPLTGGIFRSAVLVNAQTTGTPSSVSATLEGQTAALTGGPLSWSTSVPVAAHDYAAAMLEVRATDAAGNVGTASVSVFVDTVAPVVTITAPMPAQQFKISHFTASPDVTTTWTVQDGDPQAATTLVNGSSSTATSLARATSATDNPTTYTNTVVAADRAGNTATASVSYAVDRVAPRVTAWSPVVAQRNHSTRRTEVVFSERMTGGSGILSTGATFAGSWNVGGDDYQLADDSLAGKAVDFFINPALTDSFGNPVANDPGHKRIHFATWFAPGSVQTLATSVRDFDVTSDLDGVATISYATIATLPLRANIGVLTDTGGRFVTLFSAAGGVAPDGTTFSLPSLTSWNAVNATTLESSPRATFSLTRTDYDSITHGGTQSFSVSRVLDGGITTQSYPVISAGISAPPLAGESGTALFGTLTNGAFERSPAPAVVMPTVGFQATEQSSVNWTAVKVVANQVVSDRFFCKGTTCGAVEYLADSTTPTKVAAGTTRSGSCFALTWDSSAVRYGYFQVRPACETTVSVCPASTTVSAAVLALSDLRVGTWDANGEDTLLFSYRSGSDLVLAKMAAGACSTSSTELARWTVAGAKVHAPVRIGNSAALLYIDASDALKLQLP